MKTWIVHLPKNEQSVEQATQAHESFRSHGWDAKLVEGITVDTYDAKARVRRLMEGGRLTKFEDPRLSIKKSCVNNHIVFWEKVASCGETMAFIEHDALAIAPPEKWDFEDVLILNMDYAFNFGALKGKIRYTFPPAIQTVVDLPEDYPLRCRVDTSRYKGSMMMPGTAAYAVTPKGAHRLLSAVTRYGLEQSDYIINSMNVKLQYANPSPVKFNSKNLSTSNG